MGRRWLIIIILLFAGFILKGQTPDTTSHRNKKDSLNLKRDSITSKPFREVIRPPKKEKVYHPDSNHSPKKAAIRSLIFPGLGQIYNRHGLWWRLPALYTGLSLLAYNIYTNGKDYNAFLKESVWREQGRPLSTPEPLPVYQGTSLTGIDDATIYAYKDNLRRNRDLSIFSFVGVWGINIVDAYVEAKFIHSYTMDDNLSFKVSPSVMSQPAYASNFNSTFAPALKITFFFK